MKKKLLTDSIMGPGFRRPVLNESSGKKEGAWSVFIWTLGERNLNGRTYTRELAERIVGENRDTLCNDGHDNYLSEYANSMAHAFNPRIENNQLWVDFEFIDKGYEEKISFCLDHGIPVGVSSVGLGECDDSGIVNPETYELVRYFDFVQHPANESFVTAESVEEKPEDPAAAGSSDASALANLRKAFRLHLEHNE